ncbi:HAMP domain-containing histidine kinase, partial [Patescibacteria group bacterium]|nr:HAMP domain-containing histidine kinase [Patescibacteria group bacterium]
VLVKEICDNLQKAAKEKGLYLNFKTIGKIPTVNADDEKIRQVVINFIDNAIKYTKEGGITATVSFVNNKVTCCVQDTGMGVRKEVKSQLFKKFSRGKGAFLVNTEGTGLGLYVAHMMIDSHQGGIWVESEGEGKGSKFCFDLPIGKPNAS